MMAKCPVLSCQWCDEREDCSCGETVCDAAQPVAPRLLGDDEPTPDWCPLRGEAIEAMHSSLIASLAESFRDLVREVCRTGVHFLSTGTPTWEHWKLQMELAFCSKPKQLPFIGPIGYLPPHEAA